MNLKRWDSSAIPLRRRNVNSIGPKPYNANHNSSCSSKTTAVFKKIKKKIFVCKSVSSSSLTLRALKMERGEHLHWSLWLVGVVIFVCLVFLNQGQNP